MIDKVGPGGNFLVEKHTFKNFRKELCLCDLAKSQLHGDWVKEGSKTMEDKMYERLQSILKEHEPEPLTKEKAQRLTEIVERAEKEKL